MKKLRFLLVSVISFSLFFSLLPIYAQDFAENEAYWEDICTNPATSKNNIEACRGYADFLNKKVADSQDKAEEYKDSIKQYEGDIEKQVAIAKGYELKIEEFGQDIINLNNNIVKLENNIKKIEAEIIAREAEIAEKDRIIVERMRKTQSDMRFGHEIDFLVKAKDFATLIASAATVNDIMAFEAIQIEEINNLIAKQKADQDTIKLQQETVKLNLADVKNKKAQVESLKDAVEAVIANYKKKADELAVLQSQAVADASAIKKRMKEIETAINKVESSTGFTRPIAGGYISARVWAYPAPWSAMHLGYDYAAPIGTPIRAGANGFVLASYDGFPTVGHLGNWSGRPGMAGGGNQVFLIATVNGKLYGLTYFHMQKNTTIKSGQTVAAGQVIGLMGSSGNSTGPHVHVEVLYLGSQSIGEYISNWNGRLDHGIGMNLSNRCDFNGNRTPCRMDPGKAFGYN